MIRSGTGVKPWGPGRRLRWQGLPLYFNVPGASTSRSQPGAEIHEKPGSGVISLWLAGDLASWKLLRLWGHICHLEP